MPDSDCFTFSEDSGLICFLADLGDRVEAGQPIALIYPADRSGVALCCICGVAVHRAAFPRPGQAGRLRGRGGGPALALCHRDQFRQRPDAQLFRDAGAVIHRARADPRKQGSNILAGGGRIGDMRHDFRLARRQPVKQRLLLLRLRGGIHLAAALVKGRLDPFDQGGLRKGFPENR